MVCVSVFYPRTEWCIIIIIIFSTRFVFYLDYYYNFFFNFPLCVGQQNNCKCYCCWCVVNVDVCLINNSVHDFIGFDSNVKIKLKEKEEEPRIVISAEFSMNFKWTYNLEYNIIIDTTERRNFYGIFLFDTSNFFSLWCLLFKVWCYLLFISGGCICAVCAYFCYIT